MTFVVGRFLRSSIQFSLARSAAFAILKMVVVGAGASFLSVKWYFCLYKKGCVLVFLSRFNQI